MSWCQTKSQGFISWTKIRRSFNLILVQFDAEVSYFSPPTFNFSASKNPKSRF